LYPQASGVNLNSEGAFENAAAFAEEWEILAARVKAEDSQLVVLPEIPFTPWFVLSPG